MFTENKHKPLNEQMYIGLGIQSLLCLRINLYHTKYFSNSIIMHEGDTPYPHCVLRTALFWPCVLRTAMFWPCILRTV